MYPKVFQLLGGALLLLAFTTQFTILEPYASDIEKRLDTARDALVPHTYFLLNSILAQQSSEPGSQPDPQRLQEAAREHATSVMILVVASGLPESEMIAHQRSLTASVDAVRDRVSLEIYKNRANRVRSKAEVTFLDTYERKNATVKRWRRGYLAMYALGGLLSLLGTYWAR